MFCMRCGAALPEGAKFCTACGQPAGAPSARAAAPAASPAFSRYLALVEGRAGAPGTYVADLCAWQFYSTRMSAALAKMKQFFFLREMEARMARRRRPLPRPACSGPWPTIPACRAASRTAW